MKPAPARVTVTRLSDAWAPPNAQSIGRVREGQKKFARAARLLPRCFHTDARAATVGQGASRGLTPALRLGGRHAYAKVAAPRACDTSENCAVLEAFTRPSLRTPPPSADNPSYRDRPQGARLAAPDGITR